MQSAEELIAKLKEERTVYDNPNSDFYDLRQVIDTEEGIALIRARDREIVDVVVNLFDKYASFDPHGNGNDAHIICSNDLRDDLKKLKKSLTGED